MNMCIKIQMQFIKPLLFIIALFSSHNQSAANTFVDELCSLNVTLSSDTPYFLTKAFNQWKTDPTDPARLFCGENDVSIPVQASLTGRGLSFPPSPNSKIRLTILLPQGDVAFLLNRSISLSLFQKRLMIDSAYDLKELERIEIHIDSTLTDDETKSISNSVILIKQATEQ